MGGEAGTRATAIVMRPRQYPRPTQLPPTAKPLRAEKCRQTPSGNAQAIRPNLPSRVRKISRQASRGAAAGEATDRRVYAFEIRFRRPAVNPAA